jgi:hypothetical protein
MLDILQRRFGLVMFVWVLCLVAITLGVKVNASDMATVSAAAGHPIAAFISFFMGAVWYLTFLTVVAGVSKSYWLERFANSKRHSNW